MSDVRARTNAAEEEDGGTPPRPQRVSRRTPARSRNWCFTENATEDSKLLQAEQVGLEAFTSGVRYLVFQRECASTGQLHYQGYLELSAAQRLSWLKTNVSSTAHFEKRMGSQAEAIAYCKKDDTRIVGPNSGPWVFGTPSRGQGSRTDIIEFRDAILSGSRRSMLIDSFPLQMARFPRFTLEVRRTIRPPITQDFKVILYYGETGVGKTRWVEEHWRNKEGGFWRLPIVSSALWFDGYDGEERVLFDDFAGAASKVSLVNLLQILDRYPIQVPVKGSFVWWHPKRIAITTNSHPNSWYKWTGRMPSYFALRRRFTKIYQFLDGVRIPATSAEDWMSEADLDLY